MARRDEGGDVRLYVLALAALPREKIIARLAALRRTGKIDDAKQRSVTRSLVKRGGVREFNKEVTDEIIRQREISRERYANRGRYREYFYSAAGEHFTSIDCTCNEDISTRGGPRGRIRTLVRRRLIEAQGSLCELWSKSRHLSNKKNRSRSQDVQFESKHLRVIDGKMVVLVSPRVRWRDQPPLVIRQDSLTPPRLSVATWPHEKRKNMSDRSLRDLKWYPLAPPVTVGDAYPDVAAQVLAAFDGCVEVLDILKKPKSYSDSLLYTMAKHIPFYFTAEDVLEVFEGQPRFSVEVIRRIVDRKCAYDACCALLGFKEGARVLHSQVLEVE